MDRHDKLFFEYFKQMALDLFDRGISIDEIEDELRRGECHENEIKEIIETIRSKSHGTS